MIDSAPGSVGTGLRSLLNVWPSKELLACYGEIVPVPQYLSHYTNMFDHHSLHAKDSCTNKGSQAEWDKQTAQGSPVPGSWGAHAYA